MELEDTLIRENNSFTLSALSLLMHFDCEECGCNPTGFLFRLKGKKNPLHVILCQKCLEQLKCLLTENIG